MVKDLSPREELIAIQKSLVLHYKGEIRETLEEDPEITMYTEEHRREVSSYERISGKAEIISDILESGVVYVGDYHSLKQSQRAFRSLVQDVSRIRPGLVLCMEAFLTRHQKHLNAYQEGRIEPEEFLRAVDFEKTWGFSWPCINSILEFARKQEIPVVALNVRPRKGNDRLARRDDHAAKVIASAAKRWPDRLLMVLDGEVHLAACHLPNRVDAELKKRGLSRRRLIVNQNSEEIYWDLAEKKLEHVVDVVKIDRERYCLITSTPLIMYQSYIHWLENQEELDYRIPFEKEADRDRIDFTSQMYELVRVIAEFLGITEVRLDDFTVYTTGDLDFLEILHKEGGFTRKEIEHIKAHILKQESYFITDRNIIYLSSLSVNHAAEEAAHFINVKCSEYVNRPLPNREDFYQRILREALGYLGSKIVNPKRQFFGVEDFVSDCKSANLAHPTRILELAAVSEAVVRHKEFERAYMQGKKRISPAVRKIWEQPMTIHIGITHALGYMLGEKLFDALLWKYIDRAEVKDLFFRQFRRAGEAFRLYMDYQDRLIDLPKAESF